MAEFPQRQSLVVQATAFLRSEIEAGVWLEWLPGERALCERLHVSRNTLRATLRQLAADGLIRPEQGRGSRVLARSTPSSLVVRKRIIGLLTPEPLERLRPTQTLWIDELRALLIEHDCRLQVISNPQCYRSSPGKALEKLLSQHPFGCWILMLSTESVQTWFQRQAIPCLIAGSPYTGINLPFVDLDHRALCRHAASLLLRLGHRSIAFLSQRRHRAGDVESERGFLEGIRSSGRDDIESQVAWHQASVENVRAVLRRLMAHHRPPTALLVANPFFYLTVTSYLAQTGLRVPRDIAVMSRDEDPFLSFLLPKPAHYAIRPHVFAKKLLRPLLDTLEGSAVASRSVKIMPQFLPGDSVGPPAGQMVRG
jgi:DNA-binding LacI/PurR family transcriptional regulator